MILFESMRTDDARLGNPEAYIDGYEHNEDYIIVPSYRGYQVFERGEYDWKEYFFYRFTFVPNNGYDFRASYRKANPEDIDLAIERVRGLLHKKEDSNYISCVTICK